MLLPALLLELRVDSVTREVVDSHQGLCDVEHETGLWTEWDLPRIPEIEQDKSEGLGNRQLSTTFHSN